MLSNKKDLKVTRHRKRLNISQMLMFQYLTRRSAIP